MVVVSIVVVGMAVFVVDVVVVASVVEVELFPALSVVPL